MNLNLMHRRSLMQQNEGEFKSNCRQRSISINNSHLNYINLYPKSNLNLNSNTKLNRTSGPNSPAAEAQPVAKLQPKLQLQPQPQPKPSNRVWMCDIFDRLRYALRVLPAETRLTVYRRFEIIRTLKASLNGRKKMLSIFNAKHIKTR